MSYYRLRHGKFIYLPQEYDTVGCFGDGSIQNQEEMKEVLYAVIMNSFGGSNNDFLLGYNDTFDQLIAQACKKADRYYYFDQDENRLITIPKLFNFLQEDITPNLINDTSIQRSRGHLEYLVDYLYSEYDTISERNVIKPFFPNPDEISDDINKKWSKEKAIEWAKLKELEWEAYKDNFMFSDRSILYEGEIAETVMLGLLPFMDSITDYRNQAESNAKQWNISVRDVILVDFCDYILCYAAGANSDVARIQKYAVSKGKQVIDLNTLLLMKNYTNEYLWVRVSDISLSIGETAVLAPQIGAKNNENQVSEGYMPDEWIWRAAFIPRWTVEKGDSEIIGIHCKNKYWPDFHKEELENAGYELEIRALREGSIKLAFDIGNIHNIINVIIKEPRRSVILSDDFLEKLKQYGIQKTDNLDLLLTQIDEKIASLEAMNEDTLQE